MTSRVTNAELKDEINTLRREIAQLREDIAKIMVLQNTEAQRCPHREEIARAVNGLRAIEKIEARQREVDMKLASISVVIGLVSAAIGSAVTNAVLRLLGQ